jgi:sugar phosphate isomerase/epimerase
LNSEISYKLQVPSDEKEVEHVTANLIAGKISLNERAHRTQVNGMSFHVHYLRNAVGPIVGLNLDLSHLIWMGADPILSARELGAAIHHVHGKDVRLERHLSGVNGVMETKEVTDVANRAWKYVAVGCGQDLQWWKEFFSVVKMMGYDEEVSLEMEDLTMSVEAGVRTSVEALKQTLSF